MNYCCPCAYDTETVPAVTIATQKGVCFGRLPVGRAQHFHSERVRNPNLNSIKRTKSLNIHIFACRNRCYSRNLLSSLKLYVCYYKHIAILYVNL